MKELTSDRVIDDLARARLLVALDYDGTLAPIVRDPARAVMRPSTRALLERVARLYPTVILTGRARAALVPLLAGIGVARIVGNHGAEWGTRRLKQVAAWHRALRRLRDVHIEDKGGSLSLHYRRARDKRRARSAILAAVRDLAGARIVMGKQVVNVLPADAPDKGDALLALMRRLGCDAALFIGDDVTDEDVFALDGPTLLTVRIGRKRGSHARYFIPRQRDIDHLLRLLLRPRLAAAA
jgi:trehalose 6-phosphate phosphatase